MFQIKKIVDITTKEDKKFIIILIIMGHHCAHL
jgi:hypothetical protein